jgi:hypothetical protein
MAEKIKIVCEDALALPPITLASPDGKRSFNVRANRPPAPIDLEPFFRGPPDPTPAIISLVAATTIPGHRAVMLDADGNAALADPTQSPFILAGVSSTAANTGGRVNVIVSGLIENDLWSFTPLSPIFVAPEGRLVQVRPQSGVLQIIGAARTPTSLLISPLSPTVLN